MSKLKGINRRDFLNGVALTGLTGVTLAGAAALGVSPAKAMANGLVDSKGAWTYPPAKTGLRGSHVGSFEVAHAISWEGKSYDRPRKAKDGQYDLVVVGAGISGLAAAVLAEEKLGAGARILILDNHDDFGGHAKRNEFNVDGELLVGYGGSQSLESPAHYSAGSKAFLETLGIDTEKFYRYFDQSFYERQGLTAGVHPGAETFGESGLLKRSRTGGSHNVLAAYGDAEKAELSTLITGLPLEDADKKALHHWLVDQPDWLAHLSRDEKIDYLARTSFEECMIKHGGLGEMARELLRDEVVGTWGLGWDALSGLEAVRFGIGGTLGLGLDPLDVPEPYDSEEPYIFHFPDGNAGVARLAVAKLIPNAVEASTMEEEALARVHYDRLDLAENSVRIRLSSTAVEARNTAEGVEITYVRDGRAERVEARYGIMACYGHILPFIMPELGEEQIEALQWPEKVPLAYVNVALRNWRAFKQAGVNYVYTPGAFYSNFSLDFPVSMGGYAFSSDPEKPILVHMVHIPKAPGLMSREQHKAGRYQMYGTSFEEFEQAAIDQLTGALGPYGFDAERDIAAITVNRWPHGYAYEYNELFDGGWSPENGPHLTARARVGKLAIANSDSSAYAYVNGAVDAAIRAVDELFG
ncbi:NAD(P)-binding protein [Kordiimonas lipolytica]|uniref:NAD(P)-binding protein n=1 Tax=Kordiimonas lipolytica TaxID=1662421 RepID=A0ABV8UAI0_9PROT|nr:NAD(P)/FAD-dependent oxidoreductase [Kordiimonas lipolytica]